MASFLSNILSVFSGGGKSSTEAAAGPSGEPQLYGDCTIYAEPQKEGGQYRLAGRIEKKVGEDVLVRKFIRADLFPRPMMRSNARCARRSRSSISTAPPSSAMARSFGRSERSLAGQDFVRTDISRCFSKL